MTAEKLYEELEQNAMERLKWLVLQKFGVLPGSKRALELSDEDFILCGANMVLDRRLSKCMGSFEGSENEGFDFSAFERRLRAEHG